MKVLITSRLTGEMRSMVERAGHEVEMNPGDGKMDRGELLERVGDKEGLLCNIVDRIDGELLDHAPRLRIIANYGVGFDHVDVEEVTRRGIPVTNTPGVLTDATADTAFALILATARRVVEGDHMARTDGFREWAPFRFLGTQVSGKTLGIVGFGRIGRAVARRAAGFDMTILVHSRTRLEADEERRLGVCWTTFEELLARSDFVSLHVPLGPGTRHLVGESRLRLMKPSAILVNTSRGPVVDEAALVRALEEGVIAGAGLDVYEREPDLAPGLAARRNAVLLPHVGSATVETRTRMGLMAIENLLAGLRGEMPPNCLNAEVLVGRE